MKTLFKLLTVFLISLSTAYAEWTPHEESSIVKYASLIVIAEFKEVLKEEKNNGDKHQQVEFKTIELLKGKKPEKLIVTGEYLEECAPQYYFKNKAGDRYLLILYRQHDGSYLPLSGEYGAMQIKDKSVMWYKKNAKDPHLRDKQQLSDVEIPLSQSFPKIGLNAFH